MVGTYILYNFILIGSTFFAWLYEKVNNRLFAKFCLCIIFFIFFIPSAIRYNVGTDYWSYVDIFNNINLELDSHTEIGYQLLNKFVYYLGLDAEWLIALIAFLTYFFILKGYPKKGAWLINFIFVTVLYLYTYSNLRTCLVLSIMYYAIMRYLNKQNLLHFLFYIAISCLFHKSAIVFLIIPVLYSHFFIKLMSNFFVILIVISLLIFIFIYKEQVSFFLLHSKLIDLFKYYYYANSFLFSDQAIVSTKIGRFLKYLPFIIYILFAFIYTSKTKQIIFGINLSVLLLFCAIMTLSIEIFSRLEILFFVISYMCIVYFTINNFKKNQFIIMSLIIVLIYSAYYERSININRSDKCSGIRISPYNTIFNKEDDRSLTIPRTVCEYQ